ncbi:MAG: TolC family protein [Bacteroidetes bacterium]|nr:TolC family protein [Bacteroidota bacterium]
MRHRLYFLIILLLPAVAATAQKWDLRKCVDYALANNITIKQTDLQSTLAKLTLNQSKMGQYPGLSFSSNESFNSGRNQSPTSYSLVTQSYLSSGFQLQTSAEIFNWFSKRNAILANEWELAAANASTDKLKNDIALVVANSYLQILLAKEQEEIAKVQLEQSKAQLVNTRKMVDAGSLPELNASEQEAQVARDSSTYITAIGNTTQSVLNLKAYMSLDAATPFEVDTPPVDLIPLEKIADLQPDFVYNLAVANLPQQKYNDFKLKAAQKSVLSTKGAMYPTISAFGSLGSSYVASFNIPAYTSSTVIGKTGLQADAGGGVYYDVLGPITSYTPNGTAKSNPFFNQLSDNFRQSVGVSLSVPIFNGSSLRTNYERSKVNVLNLQYQQQADNLKLKQDIYGAYNSAMVALQKYEAGKKTVEAAQKSFDFSQKRWDVGMLSTFELITNQNNLTTAKLQNSLNHFDYVFKMKVLEFYKGQGLKL